MTVSSVGLSHWVWKLVKLGLGFLLCLFFLGGLGFMIEAISAILDGRFVAFRDELVGAVVCFSLAWLIGKLLSKINRRILDRVIANLASILRADGISALSHHNQGVACHQQRDFAKAIAHFDAALRLDPTLVNAHVGRVNAYGAIGQFDRVIVDYTQAIQLDPHQAIAYCARATAYNGLGRFDRSIPDATDAIRLAPELYLGYDARGWAYFQRGNFNWVVKLVAIGWMVVTFAYLRRGHFDWRTPVGTRADFEQAVVDFTAAAQSARLGLLPGSSPGIAGAWRKDMATADKSFAREERI
jgi:tetratricopeptide (TPR) repeat protein